MKSRLALELRHLAAREVLGVLCPCDHLFLDELKTLIFDAVNGITLFSFMLFNLLD